MNTAVAALAPARRGPAVAFALLVLLILALQFGPLVGLVAFNATGDERWALNGALRDALILALAVLAALASLSRGPAGAAAPLGADRWALGLIGLYAALALLSASSPFVVALNLRRLVLVPLLFVAVLHIHWTPGQVDRLFALVVTSSAVVAVLGLAEWLAPTTLWSDVLQIDRYSAVNGFDRFGHIGFENSGRFFSGDLEPWIGMQLRRTVSSYLEPTTLAAAMAALLAAAAARGARGRPSPLLLMLAVVCGLATISKGFVLFVLVVVAWRTVGVPSPRHMPVLVLLGCALAWWAAQFSLAGPLSHIAGLTTALQHLAAGNWFGAGIGEAGNYTESGSDVGEESGLGNVIAQVGVLAGLSLVWVAVLTRDILRAAEARRDPGGPWLAAWLVFFWTVTYLFSASSLGVGGNALGFVLLALYLHPSSGPRRLS